MKESWEGYLVAKPRLRKLSRPTFLKRPWNYHHIPVHLAFTLDWLFAEAELKSGGGDPFPVGAAGGLCVVQQPGVRSGGG